MRLVKAECQNCGSQLELNLDKLQAYCPYCGSKLFIDVENLSGIIDSLEKTKQEQERTKQAYYEYQSNKDNSKNDLTKTLINSKAFPIIVIYSFLLIMLLVTMFL